MSQSKSRGVDHYEYPDVLNVQDTIVVVGKEIHIKGGGTPGVYRVVEIQLNMRTKSPIIWCLVDKKVKAFSDAELLGRTWRKKS